MRTRPFFSALASRNPGGRIAAARLRVRCASAGLDLAAVVFVLGLAPLAVHAACPDEPKASVDWSGCEKQRLLLGKANPHGAQLRPAPFQCSDIARANLPVA